jgi:hypothetical protein
MTVAAWTTLGVVIAMLVVLVRDWLPPAVAVFGAVVVLLVAGVVGPEQAFSGSCKRSVGGGTPRP